MNINNCNLGNLNKLSLINQLIQVNSYPNI